MQCCTQGYIVKQLLQEKNIFVMIPNGGEPTNDAQEFCVLLIYSIFRFVSGKKKSITLPSFTEHIMTQSCSDEEEIKILSFALLLFTNLSFVLVYPNAFAAFYFLTTIHLAVCPLMLMMSSKIQTKTILSFTFNTFSCSTWIHKALSSLILPLLSHTTKMRLRITHGLVSVNQMWLTLNIN